MRHVEAVYRAVRSRIRALVGAFIHAWRKRSQRKRGLPADLSSEDIQKFAETMGVGPIRKVLYDHLSGWKRLGAFRLHLTGASETFSVVYKNAVYNVMEIAALSGLPVAPGPPEYDVYCCAERSIGAYLPEIYLLRCNQTGRHYQYLLEDLGRSYHISNHAESILSVCRALPDLYQKMEESLDTKHRSNLLCYDRAFSENILDYANTCFRRYVKKKPSQQVQQLLADWKGITRVYSEAMDEVYDRSSLHLIHGDLNFSNIHIHKQKVGRLKIVDWEWAGIGGWWFDLVALLKMVAPDLEQEGFDVFLKASNRQNRCFEQRIYQWAKLQRGLFDASFFAKECVDSALVTRRKINIEHHMLRALDRAQLALQELQKKGLTACRLNP